MAQHGEQWTPKLVRARLVEASIWLRYHGGPVGPSGIRSGMPVYRASLEDHLDEGWGLPEVAEDDAEDRGRPAPPPADRIALLEDALTWVGRFVVPEHRVLAHILNLWLRSKAYRSDFDGVCKRLRISRGHAYRLRDRALAQIAVGLDREGTSVW